jgi:hypothetical protein
MPMTSHMRGTLALLSAALIACSNGNEPEGGLTLVGSLPPRANPGWTLAEPVTVRLVDSDGEPRPGVPVHWTITAGGGSVEPVAAETDSDGEASAVWTLGPGAGENGLTAAIAEGPTVPVAIDAEAFRVSALASGFQLGCGLIDGAIWCWGDEAWTATGHSSVPADAFGWRLDAPGRIAGPENFNAVAVSGAVVCGIDDAGAVLCASEAAPTLAPVVGLPPMQAIVGTSASAGSFCGLDAAASEAWCWESSTAPAKVPSSPAFTTIDIERPFGNAPILGCGLIANGAAMCWGNGALGNGTFGTSESPVPVSGDHAFVEIAVAGQAACGRKLNGEVWCWGRNNEGQLGVEGPDAPEPVQSATGVDHIAASQEIVLALRGNSVDRWGGEGWLIEPGPVATLEGQEVTAFAADGSECVWLADSQVYCWGEMWDRSTVFKTELFAPVHPLVDP